MLLRAAIAAFGLGGLCTPALATEWVNCVAPDGAATFDFLTGTVDVLSIVGVNVSVGEQVWANSAAYGPGDPVVIGQAYENSDMVLIDLMDEAMASRIAELRLFKASEASDTVLGGTLRIPGHGAWPVRCSGP